MNIEQETSNFEIFHLSLDIQKHLVGMGENNGPNTRP
jgi:hypothetical protein